MFGRSGVAHATSWEVERSKDPFTGGTNLLVQASGEHGGGFLVRCYEGKLAFFLEIPPQLPITHINHGLAKQLFGPTSVQPPDYRFRVDRSVIFDGGDIVVHRGNDVYVGGITFSQEDSPLLTGDVGAGKIAMKLVSSNQLIYQMPPRKGRVFNISLSGASKYVLPVVQECRGRQSKKQSFAPRSQPKAEKKRGTPLKNLLLKNLAAKPLPQERPTQQATAKPQPSSQPIAPLGSQLSVSVMDLVRQQIEQCWHLQTAGAPNPGSLMPEFRVDMNPDGTVRSATLMNPERLSDPFFQAAADSARRALFNPRCQPLKLPPQKYDQWQTFTITFDPKDLS